MEKILAFVLIIIYMAIWEHYAANIIHDLMIGYKRRGIVTIYAIGIGAGFFWWVWLIGMTILSLRGLYFAKNAIRKNRKLETWRK